MFIVVLFTKAPNSNNSKIFISRRINRQITIYSYNGIVLLSILRNEPLMNETTWRNLADIMLSGKARHK